MPIGPEETADLWYALARLQFNTFSCWTWTAASPAGHWVTLISRVTEHTSEYSITCIDKVMETVDLTGVSRVVAWSDCGPHFRSYRVLCHQAWRWPLKFGVDVEVNYGLECPFKNPCDTCFAGLGQRRRAAAAERMLRNVADVVSAYEHGAEERRAVDSRAPRETFIEWLPQAKSTLEVHKLKASSLPAAIKQCHCWVFTRADKRRVDFLAVDGETLSGIRCRCQMFVGCKVGGGSTVHPKVTACQDRTMQIKN